MRLENIPTATLWDVNQTDVSRFSNELTTNEFLKLGIKLMKEMNEETLSEYTMSQLMADAEEYDIFIERRKTIDFYYKRLKDFKGD